MKNEFLVLLVTAGVILLVFGLTGCGTKDPIDWPAETDCNYYSVEPVGNCNKVIELCTYGGEHCMATSLCGVYHSNGCVKI